MHLARCLPLVITLFAVTSAHAQDKTAGVDKIFTLRFVRDNDGKVVGIDFHSPVFRNLRFTRLSDATSGR